ncbi:MAG: abortive infection family protein [Streptococcaceae bacterium]|jgi:hypothetical protein|nr:abortive infection family protein [Streptococcaceae bacterium]
MSLLKENELLTKNIEKMFQLVELFPEDAISNAQTVLESTYKIILDEYRISFDEKEDIPVLRRKVVNILRLNTRNQNKKSEIGQISIKILAGLEQIAQELNDLRNKYSSSHGHGNNQIEIPIRYAKLATKSAEMISEFLFLTMDERQGKSSEKD